MHGNLWLLAQVLTNSIFGSCRKRENLTAGEGLQWHARMQAHTNAHTHAQTEGQVKDITPLLPILTSCPMPKSKLPGYAHNKVRH